MNKVKNFFIKIGTWFKNHAPSKRRIIQLYAALLYNANIKGFITGRIFKGDTKNVCVPGLNCYSCPGAVGSCPLGALQNALNSSNKTVPYYMLGIILLFGVTLARTICGFLCPIGMLQELLYKIKTPKIKKTKVTYVLSFFKWVVLIVFVLAIPIGFSFAGYADPGFCKYFCPAGTFGGGFMLLINPNNTDMFDMLGVLFSWKTALLFVFIVMCIFMYRFFCRFFCPLGLIYGLFNKFSLVGVVVNKSKCSDCGLCVNACKMDIRKVGDMECINCGECITVCPENAITWKGSKIFLHKNQLDAIDSHTKIDIISTLPRIEGAQEVEPKVEEKVETIEVVETSNKPLSDKKLRKLLLKTNAENLQIAAELKDFDEIINKLTRALNNEDLQLTQKEIERLTSKINKYQLRKDTAQAKFDKNLTAINEIKEKLGVEITTEKVKEKLPLYDKKKTKIFFICLFSALSIATAGALIYYNFIDGATPPTTEPTTSQPSTEGPTNPDLPTPVDKLTSVGQVPNSFSVELYNSEIPTYDYNYDQFDGKIKIFNFWATWCGPCVHELPYFNEFYKNYKDQIEIVAICNSYELKSDVQEYIDTNFAGYEIQFAHDNEGDAVFQALGGKDAIPHTVILDENNVCQYVATKSMTYEQLEGIVVPLLNK